MKLPGARIPPFWADGLLALAVFTVAATVPADGPDGLGVAEGTASFLLIGLGSAGLVLRRPYPIPVWLNALTMATTGTLIAGSVSPALLPTLVALYTLASRGPRNRGVAAAVERAQRAEESREREARSDESPRKG